MATMRNIDLHSHSKISDGTLAPAEVAARARANGVDVWALTDHDEVSGVAQAREAAAAYGLQHVSGVEISVTWAGKTIHIVGLHIDETHPDLLAGLAATRGGRADRAREIGARLAAVGIPGAFEGALRFVGNPDLVSRTHFARYLVEIGVCADVQNVFRKYLTEGKPGYVPHRWARLDDAVKWIRASGGIAIVAHPGRYDFTSLQEAAFLAEFKAAGGAGIEVVTGSHTPDQYDDYARVAKTYGLLASRGSDFHGPQESQIDLGALPSLPAGLTPVWNDWKF
jgi:predicted metal-dependent phosphoesterase TrpH